MTNQEFWTKRFTDAMEAAKRDAATIKDFIDNDIDLCAETVNRWDIGHAKIFADKLNEIAHLVENLKKRREEE